MARLIRPLCGPAAGRRALAVAALLGILVPAVQAEASTLATFQWVNTAGTGSGTLSLTLPGTIASQTFSVSNLTPAAAFADLTAFSYTFSDGLTVGLSDLTSHIFTDAGGNAISTAQVSWATSSDFHGGFGAGTVDLITGFNFSGQNSIAGGGVSNYKISQSLFSAANVGQGSNQITPTTGVASNDAGYWQLVSLSQVPLPAGFALLVSGLGLLGSMGRRRPGTGSVAQPAAQLA